MVPRIPGPEIPGAGYLYGIILGFRFGGQGRCLGSSRVRVDVWGHPYRLRRKRLRFGVRIGSDLLITIIISIAVVIVIVICISQTLICPNMS